MEIKLFDKCNNKCKLCEHLGKLGMNPSFNEIEEQLRGLRRLSTEVTLSGGEPFLREDILAILDLGEALRFKQKYIYSNARVFSNKSVANRIADYTFTLIVPFFHHTPLVHDLVTRVPGSFRESLLGIVNLRRVGVGVAVNYIVTKDNIRELVTSVQFFRGLGIKEFWLNILAEINQAFPFIKQLWEYAQQNGLNIHFENYQRELSILLNHMFTGPIVTQFEITNACNHKCVFCYHHSPHLLEPDDPYFDTHPYDKELVKRPKSWHQQRVSFEFLKGYVKEAVSTGCSYIQLGGGGEPMTHPDIMSMLRFIKKLGLRVQVFTNLTVPNANMIRELLRLGVDVLEVNVSAATPDTYSKVHTVPKSEFHKLSQNLELIHKLKSKLKARQPELRIMNPICTLNYQEIPEMVTFAHRYGASAVYLGHLQTTQLTNYLLLKPAQIKEANRLVMNALERAESLKLMHNFHQYLDVLNYRGTLKGSHTKQIYNRVGCLIPFYETQIHLDGRVAPCCLHPTIFSLDGMGFREMWNSKAYRDFRQKVLGLYRKKEKRYLCRGCRMCVYQEDIQRFYNELVEVGLAKYLGK